MSCTFFRFAAKPKKETGRSGSCARRHPQLLPCWVWTRVRARLAGTQGEDQREIPLLRHALRPRGNSDRRRAVAASDW